jgi:hypothetical protein
VPSRAGIMQYHRQARTMPYHRQARTMQYHRQAHAHATIGSVHVTARLISPAALGLATLRTGTEVPACRDQGL